MEFWLVVGLILGVVLVWAAISNHRARRYHRLRSHSEMAYDVHEHAREVRAADLGSHLDQDQSWMHRPGSTPHRPSSGGRSGHDGGEGGAARAASGGSLSLPCRLLTVIPLLSRLTRTLAFDLSTVDAIVSR